MPTELNATPPSRRHWLLPLLAMTAWWPIGSYWQSDDFLALHYARDFDHVLHDFVGPQYGATDIWWFYRPLITLSFWLDVQFAGVAPWFSHASNVVAHAISTLLVALVWRRFVPAGTAIAAAALWAVMPSHVGSIAWAVGRVDSHTTVWALLALWLSLRGLERSERGRATANAANGAVHDDSRGNLHDNLRHNLRGGLHGNLRCGLPAALATAAALASKESALVLPVLLTALVGLRARGDLPTRLAAALRVSAGAWLVLLAYLPFRLWALGRFGGYVASRYEPLAMLRGLGNVLLDLVVPLRWIGLPSAGAWLWLAAAGVPIAIALGLALRRLGWRTFAAFGLFAIAIAPMATFLQGADNPHNLRYYYLPAAALTGLLAHAGRGPALLVLLAWLWPLVAVRTAQWQADHESAQQHAHLQRLAAEHAPEPMFVAGLPHQNPAGTSVQLHFGIDRMLAPPFTAERHRLYALRPLAEVAGVVRLTEPGLPLFALPEGSTWQVSTAAADRVPGSTPLPELPLVGDDAGVLDLGTARLDAMLPTALQALLDGTDTFGLTMPGVRPQALRVTLFTANGYLSCLCLDHSAPTATDGRLDMLRFFAKDDRSQETLLRVGHLSTTDLTLCIGDALEVPTTVDLTPEFPTLIEGGTLDLVSRTFTPTHRARRLITFRFDHGYPGWVRRAQGR